MRKFLLYRSFNPVGIKFFYHSCNMGLFTFVKPINNQDEKGFYK